MTCKAGALLLAILALCPRPGLAGERCGPSTCAEGLLCCNDSCGFCAPPSGACIQPHCGWTPSRVGQYTPALPLIWPSAMTRTTVSAQLRHGAGDALQWRQAAAVHARVALDRARVHALSLRVLEGLEPGNLVGHNEVALGWNWPLALGLPWLRLGPLVEVGVVRRFEARAGVIFALGRGAWGLAGHAAWRASLSAWRTTGEKGTRTDGSTYDKYAELSGLGQGLDVGLSIGVDGTAFGHKWRTSLNGRMRRDPTDWHWPLAEVEAVFDWSGLGPFTIGAEAGLGRRVEGWPGARWPRWLALRISWLPAPQRYR